MDVLTGLGIGAGNRQWRPNVPKDHFRENVKRMRQIQRMSRDRESEARQPVKVLWKSEKYIDVQSRIKSEIDLEPMAPRPHSASFLRAHSRSGPSVTNHHRPSTPPVRTPTPDKLTVPRARSAHDIQFARNEINFIKMNGQAAKIVSVPRSSSATALDNLMKKQHDDLYNYQRGQVPKYLQVRQQQWKREEEERITNTPDPALPPGHRVMPESERVETLKLLQNNQSELTQQLQMLPLRNDTYRIRAQKQEIETKLVEIEEAIKIFTRPKVFVKMD